MYSLPYLDRLGYSKDEEVNYFSKYGYNDKSFNKANISK